MAMVLVTVAAPISGVTHRLDDASEDFHQYWQGGERGGSVGLCLEMWRTSFWLFLVRPLTGSGARAGWRRPGTLWWLRLELHPGFSIYDQLHSDLIDTAARRGLPGALWMLYSIVVSIIKILACAWWRWPG